ncbi:MAG: hypothetical protein ACOYWZ_04505 [Bacillota bacterium]
MKKIIFSKQLQSLRIPCYEGTLCIYANQYKNILPNIENCKYIDFKYFANNFREVNFLQKIKRIIYVGLNKIFTLSSRNHPVFDLLQYNIPSNIEKYSIDLCPYFGEIWKIWIHFNFVGYDFGGYTYSYLLETNYNKFKEGISKDNPVSLEKIKEYAKNKIEIEYSYYFNKPTIQVKPVSEESMNEYSILKQELFEEHNQLSPILKKLSEFAQQCYKDRKIPRIIDIFNNPDNIIIFRTTLKVDEYLTNELLEKISEVNTLIKELKDS